MLGFAKETATGSLRTLRDVWQADLRSVRVGWQADSRSVRGMWEAGSKASWWSQHRDASLNWLALGLLLAAWNASDDDAAARRRPASLRGYSHVSVRAATLNSEELRTASMK
jgi:hypothetical protein